MPITDVPILSMLRTRMQWTQERQGVLAENVANADTPRFRPRDLAPLDLAALPGGKGAATSLARTNGMHLAASEANGAQFKAERRGPFETRPTGNAVSLDDEMMKIAENQMDHQAAAMLYSRSLGLLKIALGKK